MRPLLQGALALAATALTLAAAPAAFAAQTMTLDLASAANAAPGGAVKSAVLGKGEAYVLVVTGSGSMWPGNELTAPSPLCGRPEDAPVVPSPGRLGGPAGIDAQSLFGAPAGSRLGDGYVCTSPSLPRNTASLYTAFEVALSANAWTRPVPVGGARTKPRADHTYVYDLIGTGAPAAFRFVDAPAADNYGVFGLTLLTAAECAAVQCQGIEGGSAGSAGFFAGKGGDARVAPAPVGNPAAGTAIQVKTCATTLPVKLRARSGAKLKSATVFVAGKGVLNLGKKGVAKSFTLRRLPAKNFTVLVTGKTASGKAVTSRRKVAGCRKPTKTTTVLRLA